MNNEQSSGRRGISAQFLWHIVTFLVASLLTLGVAWGTRSSQLEEVRTQMNKMSSQIDGFMESYRLNDKATSNQIIELKGHLDRMEDHLANDDRRIEELEGKRR